ncbi:cupin domain-containing protein [Parasphingorhabdus halotolerans]|uniref:Cupin domain-containing protein n=1 Tax=Parasphingorhabdus halotolerans TaxID=2725558 RepID=A0A6H2DQ57_9SPHN|nr:cupin domain-containing protein [Parasphingorhabdus halotolerans]QJB70113.1 cupin domain-containing protein [Parasphingorhabdus halotolerans]
MSDIRTRPEPLKVLRIFRSEDAQEFNEAGHMSYVDDAPVILDGLTKMGEAGVAEGYSGKCLFSGFGFSLHHFWFKPGYPLPLHSHDSDCLYYVIAGDIRMGTEEMKAGDGFFLPAETPYTYTIGENGVEILEFRTQEDFNIQFKGKTEAYWEQMLEKLRTQRPGWSDALPPSLSPTSDVQNA